MTTRRLSATDAMMLFGESSDQPMHVGGLTVMDAGPLLNDDGSLRVEDLAAAVESRLHLAPTFRCRVETVPLDLARPIWVEDPRFDIRRHIRHAALPRPGTRAQLHDLMARIQERPLDRSRPLWEIWFIEGVDGGEHIAGIWKVHHALMDGASGVELGLLLYDTSPDLRDLTPQPWSPPPPPSPAEIAADALFEGAQVSGRALTDTVSALVQRPSEAAQTIGKAVNAVAHTLSRSIRPLPFSGRVGPHRSFETASVPMDSVSDVKEAASVTVNDVVLAAVTGAMRSYLEHLGHDPADAELSSLVTVSVRPDDHEGLGNHVASLFADLPIDEADPAKRLRLVHQATRALKESDLVEGTTSVLGMYEHVPVPILRPSARGAISLRTHHVIVSNVRGPDFPLYISGARVREVYPYGGPQHQKPLFVVAFSYADTLFVGLSADADRIPDLQVLAEAVPKAVVELSNAL